MKHTVTVEMSLWEAAQCIKGLELISKRIMAAAKRRTKRNKKQVPGDLANAALDTADLNDLIARLTAKFMEARRKQEESATEVNNKE